MKEITAKWAIYIFALLLTLPIPLLCFERDENGHIAPNDNPPTTLIFILSTFAATALGIQVPRAAIARALHLPDTQPPQ